jgi:serine/threonine-protein kinase HipA
LGGARPKSSVIDTENNLWIAKFPSINDTKNMGAWEMAANKLAVNSGINVAEGKITQFNNAYHTYLSKRFDRNEKSQRIHFASAMTMLGYNDGDGHDTGASYLDIAEFLIKNGSDSNEDLKELWRRIVFNICIKNTDDHLRNHGFLLSEKGWKLSPAYDMNPNEFGTGLHLNISETDNALDLNLALSVAEHFRVKEAEAKMILGKVIDATSKWRETAQKLGLSRNEIESMKRAFELVS